MARPESSLSAISFPFAAENCTSRAEIRRLGPRRNVGEHVKGPEGVEESKAGQVRNLPLPDERRSDRARSPAAPESTRQNRNLRKPCEPPRSTARWPYSKSLQTPNASAVFG